MNMVNILKENCDPSKDNNEKLPYNAYLIQYKVGDKEEMRWDLAMGHKQSEIFDYYYDKYKNVKGIEYGSGTIPPNRFGLKPPPKKKGKTVRGK